MGSEKKTQSYWFERLGIFAASFTYLFIFNVNLPHGDALRIVRQIEASNLAWNPNHLLLDPFGYAWYSLLERIGFDITPLASFEIISFVTTIISLLLFHAVLVAAGIRGWFTRILAVTALFASKNFLSLAVTQYYFMLQMPFLLGAMLYGVRYLSAVGQDNRSVNYLYVMGALLAIATGIEVNNGLLVFLIGIVMGVTYRGKFSWNWEYTARLWGVAAAIGLPLFMIGYLLSEQNNGFFSWLLSYAGSNDSAMEEMYGLQWSLKGIAVSGARLAFNLFFGNIIETAGMGTVLKAIVFGQTLEFLPGISKMTLAFILMPVVGLFQLYLLLWSLLRIKQNVLLAFFLTWIFAYLVFAFFWNNGSNIFWFQTLPAILLIFTIYIMTLGAKANIQVDRKKYFWQKGVIAATIPLLLIVNTLQTVVPVSFTGIEKYKRKYAEILKQDDLVIVPGWDKYKWMSIDSHELRVNKLMLMNMALKPKNDEQYIGNLDNVVKKHLSGGNRVIVARLYDLDSELRPWNGLTHMGWSRVKIQSLLKEFCNDKVVTIDDVTFRKLDTCRN